MGNDPNAQKGGGHQTALKGGGAKAWTGLGEN